MIKMIIKYGYNKIKQGLTKLTDKDLLEQILAITETMIKENRKWATTLKRKYLKIDGISKRLLF